MSTRKVMAAVMFLIAGYSCNLSAPKEPNTKTDSISLESSDSAAAKADSVMKDSALLIVDTLKTDSVLVPASKVHTKNVHPNQVVEFAKTLIGVPYRYASTDPK